MWVLWLLALTLVIVGTVWMVLDKLDQPWVLLGLAGLLLIRATVVWRREHPKGRVDCGGEGSKFEKDGSGDLQATLDASRGAPTGHPTDVHRITGDSTTCLRLVK